MLQFYKKSLMAIIVLMATCSSVLMSQTSGVGVKALRFAYEAVNFDRNREGDKLRLELKVKCNQAVRASEYVRISAWLVSTDGQNEVFLFNQVVSSSMRYRLMQRKVSLGGQLANNVSLDEVVVVGDDDWSWSYQQQLGYSHWMANAQIKVREEVLGCRSCGVFDHTELIAQSEVKLFGPDDFTFSLIEPIKVTRKSFEESFVSYINFKVGRHELLLNYSSNASELSRIREFVTKAMALSADGATIDNVYVTGYASPEGQFDDNMSLSQRRSETIAQYLAKQFPTLKQKANFDVKGMGEDWDGLKAELLKNSDPNYQQAVDIIEQYATDVEREELIKALDAGGFYSTILADIYPKLRKTVFTMKYSVRPYELHELPEHFAKKAELLSLYEMHLYAQEYFVKKGKNPIDIYATAYKIYPNNKVAALNYATLLLQSGHNASKAYSILMPWHDDARVKYLQAIALRVQDKVYEAETLLRESAKAGCEEANKALK